MSSQVKVTFLCCCCFFFFSNFSRIFNFEKVKIQEEIVDLLIFMTTRIEEKHNYFVFVILYIKKNSRYNRHTRNF
jgi:hypothetical protein